MKYLSYQSYKPSDVEWLGEVPEHWEVKRLKYTATINDEALAETTDPGYEFKYVDISSVDAVSGIVAEEEMIFETAPSRARRVVRDGDTVVSTVRTYLRAIAPIWNPPDSLVVSTGFAVVRPRSVEPAFLSYALRESSFLETVVARSVGVSYPAVKASEVATIPIPLPPPPEQRAIANFLDAETAKLDTLVAKKRELIEKLKEKRSALISRTVTRGLPPEAARAVGLSIPVIPGKPEGRDPESSGKGKDWIPASAGMTEGVRFKPSGIEWVGEIPEHWSCAQLRRFICLITSGSRGWAEHYADEGAIFVRIGNLTRDSISIDLSDVQYVDPPAGAEGERTKIQSGDILFSITAYLGSVGVATEAVVGGYINQHIALVRLTGSVLIPRFLGYAALADIGQQQLNGQAYGGTKVQLALDDVKSLWLPIPPPPEQRAIAHYLDRETAKIHRMVEKVEAAIERLQEYRTALITAAVTGKIDVRNVRHSGENRNPRVEEGNGYRPPPV